MKVRSRWCHQVNWPLMAHFTTCPYCHALVEPNGHPAWEYYDGADERVVHQVGTQRKEPDSESKAPSVLGAAPEAAKPSISPCWHRLAYGLEDCWLCKRSR